MAVSAASNSFRVVKKQTTQPNLYPSPLGGMDARVPLAAESFNTCIWAINILPTEYAMRVRKGYREWVIGLGSAVRTIIPYVGRDATGSSDKIFAATNAGIYDVTAPGNPPTLKFSFSTTDANAGYGVYTAYVDESGDDLMFYADKSNGLFRYDPGTDTWAQATGITTDPDAIGTIDVTKIVFVMVHKLRVWLIEQNANKAWYLPIRSAQGAAKEFFFASKFKSGGELVGLYNWTIDGGAGRDDHLIAISRGGDVIPYTGEDPSDSTTWTTTGTFSVGPIPEGQNIAAEYGGELYVLSKFGVITMAALMRGAELSDTRANTVGTKIARLLRNDLELYDGQKGWSIRFVPTIGSIVITVPKRLDGRYRQYIFNLSTQGWGLWRDVPILSCDTWQGDLFIGDTDGRVLRMDTSRDNITLAGDIGVPIDWFMLTSYSHLGSPAVYKRAKFTRANFVAEVDPVFNCNVVYDYKTEGLSVSVPTPAFGSDTDQWDVGLWGDAIWSSDLLTPYNEILGASGLGRAAAIAIAGESYYNTDLVAIEILWDTGGML